MASLTRKTLNAHGFEHKIPEIDLCAKIYYYVLIPQEDLCTVQDTGNIVNIEPIETFMKNIGL